MKIRFLKNDSLYILKDSIKDNVDNYSSACTATSVKIANGVTFGTSKSEVVSLLGDPDSTTDDGVYYDSADGKTELYLEYDGDDKVQCIEITVYED